MKRLTIIVALALCVVAAGSLTVVAQNAEAEAKLQETLAVIRDQNAAWTARRDAINSITRDAQLRPIADRAIDDLINVLRDSDARLRSAARIVLGAIGPEAIPALTEAFKDPQAGPEAMDAFARMGQPAVRTLTELLVDPDEAVRKRAADALSQMRRNAAGAVNALIEALNDRSSQVRASAAAALGNIGEPANAAIPALIERLRDEESVVRQAAVISMGLIGTAAVNAVAPLANVLLDETGDQRLRIEAANSLGRMGAVAAPSLIEALKLDNDRVKWAAAQALAQMPADAVEIIADGLIDPDVNVRRYCAFALAKMGEKAAPAVDALINAAGDQEDIVRRNAIDALGRVGAEAGRAAPILIEALGDADFEVRLAAARSLGMIGEAAAAAVHHLAVLVANAPEADIRWSAAASLGRIGQAAEPAIPVLIGALKDESVAVRWTSAQALVGVGMGAMPALQNAVRDEEAKTWAEYAIKQLEAGE